MVLLFCYSGQLSLVLLHRSSSCLQEAKRTYSEQSPKHLDPTLSINTHRMINVREDKTSVRTLNMRYIKNEVWFCSLIC